MIIETRVAWTWGGGELSAEDAARVSLRIEGTQAVFAVDARYHGDPRPSDPAGPLWGLWDHEVVELFVAHSPTRYVELELGPHGHWITLAFAGVREAIGCPLVTHSWTSVEAGRWRGELHVSADLFRGASSFNACSIHGVGAQRVYASSTPLPGVQPDFHQPDHFLRIEWSSPPA